MKCRRHENFENLWTHRIWFKWIARGICYIEGAVLLVPACAENSICYIEGEILLWLAHAEGWNQNSGCGTFLMFLKRPKLGEKAATKNECSQDTKPIIKSRSIFTKRTEADQSLIDQCFKSNDQTQRHGMLFAITRSRYEHRNNAHRATLLSHGSIKNGDVCSRRGFKEDGTRSRNL